MSVTCATPEQCCAPEPHQEECLHPVRHYHGACDKLQTTLVCAQLEVFYELNSATIAANIRAADAFAASGLSGTSGLLLASLAEERASSTPQEAVFRSPEDRQFMMALLLHCADISNAVKPFAIAEKCARAGQPPPSISTFLPHSAVQRAWATLSLSSSHSILRLPADMLHPGCAKHCVASPHNVVVCPSALKCNGSKCCARLTPHIAIEPLFLCTSSAGTCCQPHINVQLNTI